MATTVLDRISEKQLGPYETDDAEVNGIIQTLVRHALLLEPMLCGRKTARWDGGTLAGPVGGGADAFAAAGLGPVSYVVLGLSRLGSAAAIGTSYAGRNAWKLGFASALATLARGEDWLPTQPSHSVLGRQQTRGRNAAVRLVKELGPQRGAAFLRRYESFRGRERALAELGGYEV